MLANGALFDRHFLFFIVPICKHWLNPANEEFTSLVWMVWHTQVMAMPFRYGVSSTQRQHVCGSNRFNLSNSETNLLHYSCIEPKHQVVLVCRIGLQSSLVHLGIYYMCDIDKEGYSSCRHCRFMLDVLLSYITPGTRLRTVKKKVESVRIHVTQPNMLLLSSAV